jgi:serine/threonine protein kinase
MTIEGPQIEIPNFKIMREIGSGANGTVYEARDALLGRLVAVKVWNVRGRLRAQSETAKIAGLSHPLVVTTHLFGLVDEHPYAVMELVPGMSGKQWVRNAPAVQTRVGVWKMYVRALRHIHSTGIMHGDPHLGNLIVFTDESAAFMSRNWRGEPSVAMKLADIGTSEFWQTSSDFADREARLILETATRLFKAERFNALADGLGGLGFVEMLTVCDSIVECISTLNGLPDSYAYSLVAGLLVDILMKTPMFDLDELYRQASESPVTQVRRVITRLNGALLGSNEQYWHNGNEEITDETRLLYLKWREEWRSGRRIGRRR